MAVLNPIHTSSVFFRLDGKLPMGASSIAYSPDKEEVPLTSFEDRHKKTTPGLAMTGLTFQMDIGEALSATDAATMIDFMQIQQWHAAGTSFSIQFGVLNAGQAGTSGATVPTADASAGTTTATKLGIYILQGWIKTAPITAETGEVLRAQVEVSITDRLSFFPTRS